jgi:hypothetical protein
MPGGWREQPVDVDSPYMWVRAERPTRLGPSDAWVWVVRSPPFSDDPLDNARSRALHDIHVRWGDDVDVHESRVTLAGRTAVRLRYSHPLVEALGFLGRGDVQEVRYVTMNAAQVYEIGFGGWPSLPGEAGELEEHLDLRTPTGTRKMPAPEEGFSVVVPARWNVRPGPFEDMPDAVWAAIAPPDPPSAWAILFKSDRSIDDAVEASAAKAAREGSHVERTTATVAGRRATRIDFEKPTPLATRTYYSTWLFEGSDGRTWQLLVGGLRPNPVGAAEIAESLSFRP